MEKICINNLGVGALQIKIGGRRILVDAFNSLINPVDVLPKDVIVFSHDDADHFSPEKLPDLIGKDVVIVGPPTILKPILLLKKAEIEQIEVLYTNEFDVPAAANIDTIKITCFATQHFNCWSPLHNSYMIEVSGKRIYITGDSTISEQLVEKIGKVNAIVCNLVDEGFLRGQEEAKVANQHILSYLLKVRTLMKNAKVIGVHLLGADFTVDADDINILVVALGYDDIIIPISTQQQIII